MVAAAGTTAAAAVLVAIGSRRLLVPPGPAAGGDNRRMVYVVASVIGAGLLALLAIRLGLFDRPRLVYIEPGQSVFAEFARLRSAARRARRPAGRVLWILAGVAVALGGAAALVWWLRP